jgi:peptidyl-prolyl cis-trans isomerase B (cyclophilin B)
VTKIVKMETSAGTFDIELDDAKAPDSVANFLAYVKKGHYDGTVFHRVIKGFMIQGGGFRARHEAEAHRQPDPNEANNGLKNKRYTLAMARTSDPHSATAQFFINTVDNGFLDFTAENAQGWGYAVFGKVTAGTDVVDAIEGVRTGRKGGHDDVPLEDVVIRAPTKWRDPPRPGRPAATRATCTSGRPPHWRRSTSSPTCTWRPRLPRPCRVAAPAAARHGRCRVHAGRRVRGWVGDDSRRSPSSRPGRRLASPPRRRHPVAFMAGNRDFLVGPELCAAAGLTPCPTPRCCRPGASAGCCAHGDAQCLDDTALPGLPRPGAQPAPGSRPSWPAAGRTDGGSPRDATARAAGLAGGHGQR